jgi:hypothetical protein
MMFCFCLNELSWCWWAGCLGISYQSSYVWLAFRQKESSIPAWPTARSNKGHGCTLLPRGDLHLQTAKKTTTTTTSKLPNILFFFFFGYYFKKARVEKGFAELIQKMRDKPVRLL